MKKKINMGKWVLRVTYAESGCTYWVGKKKPNGFRALGLDQWEAFPFSHKKASELERMYIDSGLCSNVLMRQY